MTLETFTFVHFVLSLVGIGAGFVVLIGLRGGKQLEGWTALFLITTVATNVTGFGFPVEHPLPSHIVGIISLVVLIVIAPSSARSAPADRASGRCAPRAGHP